MHAQEGERCVRKIVGFSLYEPTVRWQEMLTRNAGCAQAGAPTRAIGTTPDGSSFCVQRVHDADWCVPTVTLVRVEFWPIRSAACRNFFHISLAHASRECYDLQPMEDASSSQRPASEGQRPPMGNLHRRKLLVVDDEDEARAGLADI